MIKYKSFLKRLQDREWVSKDKEVFHISELSSEYIDNILNYLNKYPKFKYRNEWIKLLTDQRVKSLKRETDYLS